MVKSIMKKNFSLTHPVLITLLGVTLSSQNCSQQFTTDVQPAEVSKVEKPPESLADSQLTSPSPLPLPIEGMNPNPNSGHPSNSSDVAGSLYLPVSHANSNLVISQDFKQQNHPDRLLVFQANSNLAYLTYNIGNTAPAKLKFFFPPGTRMFSANYLAYLSNTEAKAIMKMYAPSSASLATVNETVAYSVENSGSANGGQYGGAFNETILINLIAGKSVYFFGAAAAGLMPISYGGALLPVIKRGGYVYANFQHPGGVLGSTEWRLTVDMTCYRQWYTNARWDQLNNPDESSIHHCD